MRFFTLHKNNFPFRASASPSSPSTRLLALLAAFLVLLFLTYLTLSSTHTESLAFSRATLTSTVTSDSSKMPLKRVDFEVFGKVQGVFFRKNTDAKARKLGLRGWVKNTSDGTVKGQLEGETDKVDKMKDWLTNVGSPSSRIDKAEFTNESDIKEYSFQAFKIKH